MVLSHQKCLFSGSEADFSSSSSAGSLKTRESLSSSTGKKTSSRSRGTHIRSLPVFKPPGSPHVSRDSDLYAPFRTPPKAPSSSTTSSSNSSPTTRRARTTRYHSCGDNHGIRPPYPEQYLTPLQQKEVTIRHLRTQLREAETVVHDRESEIEELKGQLGRMREDWIEEECHRVEAQLALKEARKEIKQLRQVVETMKNSLVEKDKGIQKYFIDINIQNRKLESLLHSMELAQSGSTDDGDGDADEEEEPTLDYTCDSPQKTPGKTPTTDKIEETDEGGGGGEDDCNIIKEDGEGMMAVAKEEMVDSGLLAGYETEADRTDILQQVLMSTAVDCSQNPSVTHTLAPPGLSTLGHSGLEEDPSTTTAADQSSCCSSFSLEPPLPAQLLPPQSPPPQSQPTIVLQSTSEHKAVQTEDLSYTPDLQALLLQLLKLQGGGASGSELLPPGHILELPAQEDSDHNKSADSTLADSTRPSASVTPGSTGGSDSDSGLGHSEPPSPRFMEELDFGVPRGVSPRKVDSASSSMTVAEKRYWSSSFLVDLVAVAAPVVPTVAWLYSRHGIGGEVPVYNIASLIRGCCIMGLHTLRHVTRGPNM
ncbi:syntabulin isoform X2 [Engraulis encrasicolus]|uniref:syntabulin isoform X2 n=1 Tax=Engraulis encrasicolus TaxID=184585 RepID=UPI002FD51615